jgi:hypothetical protein
MISGHDPKSEELGGNQDQVRKGKSGDHPRPPTGAGGAQAPRGGPEGDPGHPGGKTLLSKGVQKMPERPPDARQNTQTAPNPELHLSEDTPVDATVVLKRNRPCRWGIPPLIGETHLRDPLDLMNMRQRSWLTVNRTSSLPRRGRTGATCQTLQPHAERTRTASKFNGKTNPRIRDRPWKHSGRPWYPSSEPQVPEAQKTPQG